MVFLGGPERAAGRVSTQTGPHGMVIPFRACIGTESVSSPWASVTAVFSVFLSFFGFEDPTQSLD